MPALIRALAACGWLGIQTLFGGIAVHLRAIARSRTPLASTMLGRRMSAPMPLARTIASASRFERV